ncbi:tyrosine-type recombinase/integrase [Streptomyces anulatus]|uniref:tyrosine-type recombinase/integrase n=1 Tax=Streptomyces anulatus TaxID=1892 RepID=UPI00365BE506
MASGEALRLLWRGDIDAGAAEAVVTSHRTVDDVGSAYGMGDAGDVLARAGVTVGQRFVLGPDGSYDLALNRMLRELPSWGVPSRNGQEAYCSDLMLICRFLREARGGKTIWEMDGADLRAFKQARLFAKDPDDRIEYGTWQRFIAALDKWVTWSLDAELLSAEPFRYVDKVVATPNGPRQLRVNAESEPGRTSRPVRFLPYEDFLLWRDVGLRGFLPDGGRDPKWRGRNGERNALFADLLACTGMRLTEASCLLVPGVPPLMYGRGDFRLSRATTKRNTMRTVYARRRVLGDLHHFIGIERDEVVQRRRAADAYEWEDTHKVLRSSRQALVVEGGTRAWAYATLTYEDRLHLLSVDARGAELGPLWLWLGENGLPLRSSTWQSAFRRANERCAALGLDFDVHPHTLRHTFAVHMLGLLLRQTVRALGMSEDRRFTLAQIKRLLIGNPMRKLQLLLGHAHEHTVHQYLDVLDAAQEIVLAALAEWDEQFAVLEGLRVDEGAR